MKKITLSPSKGRHSEARRIPSISGNFFPPAMVRGTRTVLLLCVLILSACNTASAQTVQERDSLARDASFQLKVRMAALSAANDLLADTTVASYVTNYAQITVTSPQGGNWVNVFSYGVVNNPAITFGSSQGDIQFTVNSVFIKYAKAEYRILNRPQ